MHEFGEVVLNFDVAVHVAVAYFEDIGSNGVEIYGSPCHEGRVNFYLTPFQSLRRLCAGGWMKKPLNVSLESHLIRYLKAYAKRRYTGVSRLIADYITDLMEHDKRRGK